MKVLSRVFRGKFVAGLRRLFAHGQLRFFGDCIPLAEGKRFASFLRKLYRQDWVVYAKPPFGGPSHVLHYLARYTHRVAISNHRLLTVSASEVRFRWKDYAHGSKQRTMTLTSKSSCAASCSMSCREASPAFATSAGSPTADEPGCYRSAAPGSTRPLPLKCLSSQHRLYGIARTAMASCIASNRSPSPSSSLPIERRPSPLTPHRSWTSAATIACFQTRPLYVCLQTEHRLLADLLPSVSSYVSCSSAPSNTPSRPIGLTSYPAQLTALPPRTIQTP